MINYIIGARNISETYGTGSYPEPPHGLHLNIRQTASIKPLKGPCLRIACRAYSEQVG